MLQCVPFEFALKVAVDFVLVVETVVALVVALAIVVAVVLVGLESADELLDEGFE